MLTKPQTILVTGASGSIGSALVQKLQKLRQNRQQTSDAPQQTILTDRLNLKQNEAVDQFLKTTPVDTIYHLAALNPFKSNRGEDYFQTNVKGTERLLAGVLKAKESGQSSPKIVLTSSTLVFEPEQIKLPESLQDQLKQNESIPEDLLTPFFQETLEKVGWPNNRTDNLSERLLEHFKLKASEVFYNDSKLLAEIVAYGYQKQGANVKTVRLSNCLGENGHQLPNQFLKEVEQQKALSFANKDAESRDYVYYSPDSPKDDVLRLLVGIAEHDSSNKTYQISSDGQFVRSPLQIAQTLIQQWFGRPARGNDFVDSPQPQRGSFTRFSNQALERIGLKPPRTSPEEALTEIVSKQKVSLPAVA